MSGPELRDLPPQRLRSVEGECKLADEVQRTDESGSRHFIRALRFAIFGALGLIGTLLAEVIIDGPRGSLTVALLIIVAAGSLLLGIGLRGMARHRVESADASRASPELMQKLEAQSVEMREMKRHTEEASAARSELFAGIAHELRTPLHSIIGTLRVAIDSETSSERIHQLDMARRSAQTLLATIGDVLDFTRLEARRLELEPVYFSIRQLLADTLKPLGITAAEKALMLVYAVAAEVPDRLWGDPLRLRQILVNLTGNAIKFTSRGEVVVRVGCEAMSADGVTAVFEVSDTGAGVDPSLLPLLPGPFVAAHSLLRRQAGSGLGLAIVSRLLDAMGGTLTIDSELGKGSTFRAAVPLPCEPIGTEPPPEWEQRLASVRVLLIEPNATSRAILTEILRLHGMVPEAYATLDRALEPSIRAAYACLVSDAEVLATTPWIPPVPVVRIASPLAPPVAEEIVVTRPVGARELIEAIGAALGIAEPAITYTLERRSPIVRPLRVLVVDDNVVNQELTAGAGRRLGYIVRAVASAEAPQLLARKSFDVVLVDVAAWGLDGLEVMQRFRALDPDGRIPIIAMTASASPNAGAEERDRYIAAGFAAVLQKPATQAAIGAVIRDVTGSQTPSPGRPESSGSILDAVGGNPRLLMRVRDAFATQVPRLLTAIREAIDNKDRDAIGQAARTLRGAISNFDVPAPIAATLQIERAAAEEDFARAAALLPELEIAIRELEEKIDAALG
ncbi:MAG: two-component system, sensor histidine kinase and response regulator [Thermoanaerobaculia bacterium]|jgi:signal transduction histidine kinase/DNA-binding response OmpR family regulator|nr:two-component system, sensor histidine kinase and response regulator [Thermoanaerobaculia bacterium]